MAQTYTRTYTWPQKNNTYFTVYSRHGSTWTWGNTSISAHRAGLATQTGIGEVWGSYCTITGDTTHYATKITSISCSCYFDHPNTAGSKVYYYALGNNGSQLVTISADENSWVGAERYTKTKSGLTLSGDFLNNGIYGMVVYCSAPNQQISLDRGYSRLTITFEGTNSLKYYTNNDWQNCQAKYYDGTNWIDVIPNYYTGSGWQQI